MDQLISDFRDLVIYFASQQLGKNLVPSDFDIKAAPYDSKDFVAAIEFFDSQVPPLRFRVYLRVGSKNEVVGGFRLYEDPNYYLTNEDEVYVVEGVGSYNFLHSLKDNLSEDSFLNLNIILVDSETAFLTSDREYIAYS